MALQNVKALAASNGRDDFAAVLEQTPKAFYASHAANRGFVEAVKSKTFQYGPHERNALDIYYPPAASDINAILSYTYGGGFTTGDKRHAPPDDFVYSNLGSFFAQRGFTVVIADYRLAPEHKYPAGADDVNAALVYIQNADEAEIGIPAATKKNVFLLGHSAGSVHILTAAFKNWVAQRVLDITKIKGIILTGAISSPPGKSEITAPYYGTDSAVVVAHQPLALLAAASTEHIHSLPPILLGSGEYDPPFISSLHAKFVEEFHKHGGKKVETIVFQDHNILSHNYSLGTGEGEEWAVEVTKWAKARID